MARAAMSTIIAVTWSTHIVISLRIIVKIPADSTQQIVVKVRCHHAHSVFVVPEYNKTIGQDNCLFTLENNGKSISIICLEQVSFNATSGISY